MTVQMQPRPTHDEGSPLGPSPAQWPRALARALADALDVLIEPISGEAFVESASTPGTLYAVSATSCSCPAGQRGVPCKHRACYLAQMGELPLETEPAPAQPLPVQPAMIDCRDCNGCGVHYDRALERIGAWYPECATCKGAGQAPAPQPQPLAAVASLRAQIAAAERFLDAELYRAKNDRSDSHVQAALAHLRRLRIAAAASHRATRPTVPVERAA